MSAENQWETTQIRIYGHTENRTKQDYLPISHSHSLTRCERFFGRTSHTTHSKPSFPLKTKCTFNIGDVPPNETKQAINGHKSKLLLLLCGHIYILCSLAFLQLLLPVIIIIAMIVSNGDIF